MEEITVSTKRTPELIAAEINQLREETKRVVIYNSIEIGRRLTEAKELVSSGEWGKWLAENVDYKKSTANNLMRIFKEYGADQLSLLGSNTAKTIYNKLNYSQATILLGLAEEEKEEVIKNNDIEEMSSRELKKIVNELKKEKKARKEAEKKVEEIKEENDKKLEKANKALEDMIASKQEEIEKANKIKETAIKYQEDIEGLKEEISTLNGEINELKERPIEVTGIDESKLELEEKLKKLEEEKIKEIKKLEREKLELEKKIKESSEVVDVDDTEQRYAIYFADINDKFDKLLGALKEMKEENRADYKMATDELLKIMRESFEKI